MKINEIINKIKNYEKGIVGNKKIDDTTSRDQIVYSFKDDYKEECTGITTCVYPSIDVIKETTRKNFNFIITHESLFWNHGDKVDWLNDNETYKQKEKLLRENHIVVWRNHDYLHSGIPVAGVDGGYTDGIFYGFAQNMNWTKFVTGDKRKYDHYRLPQMKASDLAQFLINKMNLRGTRIIGNPDAVVSNVCIPFHVFGNANDDIREMDKDKIDCYLTMELVDFTLTEYVKDSAQLGRNKAIITLGHFNFEEQGMKYMAKWLSCLLNNKVPVEFIQATDMYNFVIRDDEFKESLF